MDSTLKQMLDGFRYSLDNYSSTLSPDNEKLLRARELMDSLTGKAEAGADMMSISTDPDFAAVGMLLGELASEPPAPREERAATSGQTAAGTSVDGVPPASIAAAGYHMAFDALPSAVKKKQHPYYQRIFEIEEAAPDAVHFNTMLVEDGVLLEMSREPLIESARETLEQAKDLHSPTVDFQQGLAIEAYAGVTTIAEMEYQGTLMAELSNVEHEWDGMFIEVMGLLPACAQAIEAFGPTDENVGKLRNSRLFMAEIWGVTWDDVFTDPRYLLFWNEVFWPKVPEAKRQKYDVNSADGWRDLLKEKFFDPYVSDEPAVASDPSRTLIRLWGKEYPTVDTLSLLREPPRPGISMDRG